jgi:hypothetical protein
VSLSLLVSEDEVTKKDAPKSAAAKRMALIFIIIVLRVVLF